LKQLKIIKQWIYNQKNLIEFLKKTYEKWLLIKNCNTVITINDIINNFFIDNTVFHSVDGYIDYMLSRLGIYHTDLQISDFIYKMQYHFSNTWIKRKKHFRLTNKESYNLFMLALIRIILVFDKFTSRIVTLCEDDVDFAMNILQYDNIAWATYASAEEEISGGDDDGRPNDDDDDDGGGGEIHGYDDDDNNSDDDDDDDDDVETNRRGELDEDERDFDDYFRGNDRIYAYISERCHNNVSENIEKAIQEKVLTTKIDSKLKNRINFYAS